MLLKNNNYERKDSEKRFRKKEKGKVRKEKKNVREDKSVSPPLSESIIGHIGRPQQIPLPLNEYPSTNLQGVHMIFAGKKRIIQKMISLFAFSPLL